jgi:uncharacterized RDD family membrane protein YckC
MTDPAHEVEAPRYAGFWRRFLAYLIDTVILWAVLSGIASILGVPLDQTGQQEAPSPEMIIFYLIAIILTWLYFVLSESSEKQATLGKMALKLIVTDEAGRRISFARATGRFFGKLISGIILGIGYLMVIWTAKKQALHDIIAKALIIRK